MPWYRQMMSRSLNAYAKVLLQLPLNDCSGSYRCYRVEVLRRLDLQQLQCSGYGVYEEILVHLQRAGARFCELPIRFESRHSGRSKLGFRDALRRPANHSSAGLHAAKAGRAKAHLKHGLVFAGGLRGFLHGRGQR